MRAVFGVGTNALSLLVTTFGNPNRDEATLQALSGQLDHLVNFLTVLATKVPDGSLVRPSRNPPEQEHGSPSIHLAG